MSSIITKISVDYLRKMYDMAGMPPYFMRNEQTEIKTNGLRRKQTKPRTDSSSLTIAVSYTKNDPEQVAVYKEILKEAKALGDLRVTDYMRRLCRLGRILSKDKPYVLFMPIEEQMKLRLKE